MTQNGRDVVSPSRRRFLAAFGAGAASLAGCLGGQAGMGVEDGTTANDGGPSLADHPALAGVADQPRLGPDPASATATIVAFEDPSCPRCAVFERETVPKIRTELVDTGQAAFVFRGYPVVYPWGEPATQALEATFARDAAAFWALAGHYFETQRAFDEDNVLDRTRSFLAAETDVDADAVVADAEANAYDDAVQVDLDAGEEAGAGRTTPTVFLFRDGQYQTKAAGSVSFDVVRSALGL
ncbi:DsbA family protein [Halobacteriaceae archaeon GCM10025711]